MIHRKEDFIEIKGKYYRCICADSDVAVYAPVTPHRKDTGYKTHLSSGLFCTGQEISTSIHSFKRIYRGEQRLSFPDKTKIVMDRFGILPSDGKFKLRKFGSKRAIGIFKTEDAAINAAQKIKGNDAAEYDLYIHNPNGQVKQKIAI